MVPSRRRCARCERADRHGSIAWHRRRVFIGEAFAYEHLDVWPADGHGWEVYFGHIPIGVIDAANHRFIPRRRSSGPMRLSYHGEPS